MDGSSQVKGERKLLPHGDRLEIQDRGNMYKNSTTPRRSSPIPNVSQREAKGYSQASSQNDLSVKIPHSENKSNDFLRMTPSMASVLVDSSPTKSTFQSRIPTPTKAPTLKLNNQQHKPSPINDAFSKVDEASASPVGQSSSFSISDQASRKLNMTQNLSTDEELKRQLLDEINENIECRLQLVDLQQKNNLMQKSHDKEMQELNNFQTRALREVTAKLLAESREVHDDLVSPLHGQVAVLLADKEWSKNLRNDLEMKITQLEGKAASDALSGRRKLEHMSLEISSLTNEISQMHHQKVILQSEQTDLEAKCGSLTADVKQKDLEISNLSITCQSLRESFKKSEESYGLVKVEFESRVLSLKQEIQAHADSITDKDLQIDSFTKNMDVMSTKLKESDSNLAIVEKNLNNALNHAKQNGQVVREMRTLKENFEKLKLENSSNLRRIHDQEKAIIQLEEVRKALEGAKQSEFENFASKKEQMRSAAQMLEVSLMAADKDKNKLIAKLRSYTADIEALQETITTMTKDEDILKSSNEQAHASLSSRISALKV